MSPAFSQANEGISEFHRLLIFNDKNELMVLKIKEVDFWVTPGLYSQNSETTNENLYKLAAEYGLTVTSPELRGIFLLKNKATDNNSFRHFFNVQVTGGDLKMPKNIAEVKWLPISEAMQLITFPHINMLIKQIVNQPKQVWGGTVLRYKEDNQLKSKMLKAFHSLNRN
jgi:hypothetical protein